MGTKLPDDAAFEFTEDQPSQMAWFPCSARFGRLGSYLIGIRSQWITHIVWGIRLLADGQRRGVVVRL